MEENKPPTATTTSKLKQAKLSFFKSTPISVKTNTLGQGKKRRNSGSSCLDSPTKSAKPGKPLNPIATDNTECQNTKAHKIRKICSARKNDGNDHEVSSSSEAEAGSVKCSSGKLDRFVCKWSPDPHYEISSTNELLEVCPQNGLPNEDVKTAAEDNLDNELQPAVTDVTMVPDCIIIEDTMDGTIEKSDASPNEKETLEADKSEPVAPHKSEICSEEVKSITCEDVKLNAEDVKLNAEDVKLNAEDVKLNAEDVKLNAEDVKLNAADIKLNAEDVKLNAAEDNKEDTGEDKSCEDISDANNSVSDNDISITNEENLDDSVKDISILSAACSTPIKSKDSNVSDANETGDLSVTTPATPATGSGKRRRKIDSGKKAELEQKREAERLEKKRKLEADKAEKERIKKEKQDAKDKAKQELKEKLEKEKQEKERAKEEERKKKEEERMKKEEEKKKKQAAFEAKQEEKRKKEEERKQKEEEKLREEEDKKKKVEKTKQVFQSFFIKPKDNNVKPTTAKSSTGMFIPFELKKDMHLAPAVRRDALTEDKKINLDQTLANAENCVNTYLEQLKSGDVKPHRTGRISRINPQPEEDVEIIHDSEALKKVTYRVKILQFHTDYRPPYCGTWRKKPALSARNPWKKDESVFDYEVDSDEEWEEEEPGESLSCSDGEEEKGEDGDDDDDDGDGWMVPHGYLSEDEGCNEDDEITPEKLKLQQLAKAKAWEEEQKRKLRVAPAITVGCFFENSPSQTMTGDVRLLYEYKAVMLVTIPVQTSLFGCPEPEKSEEVDSEGMATTPSQKGFQKKSVPDEAMPDLIRLVHGNTSGIKRLIREFRVHWLRKANPPTNLDNESVCEKDEADDSFSEKNGDVSGLNESVTETCNVAESDEPLLGENVNNNNDDEQMKTREEGYGCSISKRQLEIKISSMAVREKRPGFNKICWYVHEKILTQFNMSDIKLPNSWVHILPGPARAQVSNKAAECSGNISESQTPKGNKHIQVSAKNKVSKLGGNIEVMADVKDEDKIEGKDTQLRKVIKDQRSIKDFTRCKDEIVKKSENQTPIVNSVSPVIISASARQTPKNRRKPNAQKSIVEFANKSGSKKSLNKKCQPQVVNNTNTPGNQTPEVICIDSDSEHGVTDSCHVKSDSCSAITVPVISEICTSPARQPTDAASSLQMSEPALSNTDNKESPMEVDEEIENAPREEAVVEPHIGDDLGQKDGMECVITG